MTNSDFEDLDGSSEGEEDQVKIEDDLLEAQDADAVADDGTEGDEVRVSSG